MTRLLLAGIALCALCSAQISTQATPEEQLTIRVTYKDDRRVSSNLRVELISAFGSIIDTRMTDGFGTVVFAHLTPAKYKVRVSGDGVESTESAILDLTDSGPNVTEYVAVKRLQAPNGLGLSSVDDLNVPSEARKELDKGAASMEQKNWADAKLHFERAAAAYPKYALAYNNLGVTYLKLNDGAKAVEAFQRALELDEHLSQANLYLGQFYYDNKKYKEAEPCLLRAATADPRSAQILTALANTQLQNQEPDLALASAQKVHSLADHKKFAIAHLIAAQVLSGRNDTEGVRQEYRRFLEEDPKSAMAQRVREALAKLQ